LSVNYLLLVKWAYLHRARSALAAASRDFTRPPGTIVREGLMFYCSFVFNAISPRSLGRSPRNFATWSEACSIL